MVPQKQNDETKCSLVVSKLTTGAVRQVFDILILPPGVRKL